MVSKACRTDGVAPALEPRSPDEPEGGLQRDASLPSRSRFRPQTLLPALFLVATFCLLFGSLWSGGLWWKDSWYAILTTTDRPRHPQLASAVGEQFSSYWSYAVERDLALGRFRPLFWALLTAES